MYRVLLLGGLLLTMGSHPAHAQVTTDSLYVLVGGQRVFVLGSYNLPPGISLADLHDAGFNFVIDEDVDEAWANGLRAGLDLGGLMVVAPGGATTVLADTVHAYMGRPGLMVWHAPDEPAWQYDPPIPPEDIARGRDVVRAEDTALGVPHPVWMNHAARGTQEYPDSLELLAAYRDAADIFSIDIYPVPASYGGSILPDREVSSVGAYTRILTDLLRDPDGHRTKPVWMVLQAFSWSDFRFAPAWYIATRSTFDFDHVVRAAGGDFDGDGDTDLALLYSDGESAPSPQRVLVCRSDGSRFLDPQTWAATTFGALAFRDVAFAAAGDPTGDGRDDLVLLYADPAGRTKVLVAPSNGVSFAWYETWYDTTAAALDPDQVRGFEVADYDGDGVDDLAIVADRHQGSPLDQQLLVARSRRDSFAPFLAWQTVPRQTLSFDSLRAVRAGDYDGDGRADLALFHEDPSAFTSLLVARSTGNLFAPAAVWWDSLAADFPARRTKQLIAGDYDGDGRDDLVLLYSQSDTTASSQWVVTELSDGTRFRTERRGVVWSGSYAFVDIPFACGGDFSGDGLGDFALVHDYTWPPADPRQRLEVATSYGPGFGIPGPSAQETRFMAYDAILNGATGIIYWGLYFSGGPYAVWDGVRATAQQISSLSPLLVLDDDPQTVSITDQNIEWVVKRRGNGAYYLITANASSEPTPAIISGNFLASFTNAAVLFEGRSVPVTGTAFIDNFAPWDVHVYALGAHTGVDEALPALPPSFAVGPVPATREAIFTIRQPAAGDVTLAVYEPRGRKLRTLYAGPLDAGEHELRWDGRGADGSRAASGVYFVRLESGGRGIETRKIVLVR